MNLTSKRLLQFFAGCVGVCAFTAAAETQYLVDTFDESSVISWEGGSGAVIAASNGMDIAHYKSTLNYGDSSFYTNSWFAATGDASALTNETPNIADLNKKPLAGGTLGSLVLNLETEGQTLTRGVEQQPDILAGDVYVDTLIKFTPSEDAPSIANDVKAAVYVNVSSNLVIHHGGSMGVGITAGDTDVGVAISPEQWYRLTVLLHKLGDDTPVFKVFLNNSVVTSSDNAIDDDFNKGGSWFYTANQDSDTLMKAVAFQGTGLIDELVVADTANGLTTPTGIMLTLSFDEAHLAVKVNGSPVSSGTQVASGTTLVMNTVDWWQINNITGTGISFTNDVGDIGVDNLVTNSVTAVGADGASRTATIEVGLYQGDWPMGGSFTKYSLNTVATWADAKGVSLLAALSNPSYYEDDYLMNVVPNTNAKPIITSIVVDGGVATITVGATDSSVDFRSLNGTLKVYTADTLGDTFAEAGSYAIEGEAGQHSVTFNITMGTAKFIKAVVE